MKTIRTKRPNVFIVADIGASFIKIALVESQSWSIVKSQEVAFPGFIQNNFNFREVCPESITRVFGTLLDKFISSEFQYLGLLLSSQMHGFILCNSTGEALSNYISWQDTRGGSIKNLLSNNEILRTGNEIKPGIAVNNLLWLKQHGLLPQSAYLTTIADFIIAHFSKSKPHIDRTNAAGLGLLSLPKQSWDTDLIEKLSLTTINYPELKEYHQRITNLSWKGETIPCYVAIGDQQAALLGMGLQENELSINIGTGSQISMLSDKLEYGDYQVRPFVNNKFLKTITHIPAGRALNKLIALFNEIDTQKNDAEIWELVNKSVNKIVDTDLNVDLSFFPSATGDKGFIQNITENNLSIGHLFRASYKSMVMNYEQLSKRIKPEQDWQSVAFSGGIIQKNTILRKMLIDKFGQEKIRLISNSIETLEGLKILSRDVVYPTL